MPKSEITGSGCYGAALLCPRCCMLITTTTRGVDIGRAVMQATDTDSRHTGTDDRPRRHTHKHMHVYTHICCVHSCINATTCSNDNTVDCLCLCVKLGQTLQLLIDTSSCTCQEDVMHLLHGSKNYPWNANNKRIVFQLSHTDNNNNGVGCLISDCKILSQSFVRRPHGRIHSHTYDVDCHM